MLDFNFRDLEAFAARFYQGASLELTPYAYPMTFTSLAAGATATQQLNFQANADFILTNIEAVCVNASATTNITVSTLLQPLARMLVIDSGSSQPLSSGPVSLGAYAQNGNNSQKCLPYPRFVSGRSSLQVQMTSYDSALTYNIDVVFTGVNVRAL